MTLSLVTSAELSQCVRVGRGGVVKQETLITGLRAKPTTQHSPWSED